MKIAITCDEHLGITSVSAVREMVRALTQEQPDVIIAAGDLGEKTEDFEQCLILLADVAPTKLALAGNHDLWAYGTENSLELWEATLPRLSADCGFAWLEHENFYDGNIAVVGSYMHYDYSSKDRVGTCAGLSDDYYAMHKHRVNNDGRFLQGLPPDKEFATTIGAAFIQRLEEAQARSDIIQIIVVTHVPCLEQQITRKPYNFAWSVATPYFGNLSYQKQILACSKVTHVVSGHSHQAINRNAGPVAAIVIGSDYRKPRYEIINTGDK